MARSTSPWSIPSVRPVRGIAPPAKRPRSISNQARARAAVVSIKFFVLGGVYDSMIDGARQLRTTLDDYKAPVTYLEVSEGHNTNTFRGHLDDAKPHVELDHLGAIRSQHQAA